MKARKERKMLGVRQEGRQKGKKGKTSEAREDKKR